MNTPITEIVVNSLITNPADGANVKMGPVAMGGIAWDGGYGINTVEVSSDGGKTWLAATLGEDLGRFAFRTFSYNFAPKAPGKHGDGARHQQDRAKPDNRADPQSGRLSPQRRSQRHVQRGLRGSPCAL